MTDDLLSEALAATLSEHMSTVLEEITGSNDVHVTDVATYDSAGMLTDDPGVVLTLSDGSEYRMTAHLSRLPD